MSEKLCGFNEAWIGPCKALVTNPGEQCEKHHGQKCVSCGAGANSNCAETMGPFVCGAALCSKCEHTVCANGCNSGAELPVEFKAHCRKNEQVFKVWYEIG